ncbi:hypothetical protein YC2023_117712 [Brassica napus]
MCIPELTGPSSKTLSAANAASSVFLWSVQPVSKAPHTDSVGSIGIFVMTSRASCSLPARANISTKEA